MRNFKKEGFIAQYFSPKVIRDFRFFFSLNIESEKIQKILEIYDEAEYQKIR